VVAPDGGFDSRIIVGCEGGRRGALTPSTLPQCLQVRGAWLPANPCIIPLNHQKQYNHTLSQGLQVRGARLPTNSCVIPPTTINSNTPAPFHNVNRCPQNGCRKIPASPLTVVMNSVHEPIPEASFASSRRGSGAVQDSAVPAYCTRAVQRDSRTCWLQSVIRQRRVRILRLQILCRNISQLDQLQKRDREVVGVSHWIALGFRG
jgi:hypothetical protein